MGDAYSGPIVAGMKFLWSDLECTVISNPKGVGEAVKFRADDGRKFQVGEAYWRRMAALRSHHMSREG